MRGQNQVNADRARLLGEHRNRRFNFALHRHHEVGHFVDHDDDVRQHAAGVRPILERHFEIAWLLHWCPLAVGVQLHTTIELLQIAAGIRFQQTVAVLHLHDGPLEHRRRIAIVGNHLVTQVRQRVVDAELDHFRIDHQESQCTRRMPVDEARDDRVHTDGFS